VSDAGFETVLGIDWSGARSGPLKGLQVAEARPGSAAAPVLLDGPLPGGRWSRGSVLDLLVRRIEGGERLLAGIDFAFAYAHGDRGAYFPGLDAGPESARELWRFVDGFGQPGDDFYGGHVYQPGSPVREHYMAPNLKGRLYTHRQRRTEIACAAQVTSPHPVFKCIGAANVGTGSLAGMRVLHALKERLGDRVTIWPFDASTPGPATVCEIFPRQYFKRAAVDPRAWRDPQVIDQALDYHGTGPYSGAPLDTEDKADAVVSAAALQALSEIEQLWHRPDLYPEAQREGWIFGVL